MNLTLLLECYEVRNFSSSTTTLRFYCGPICEMPLTNCSAFVVSCHRAPVCFGSIVCMLYMQQISRRVRVEKASCVAGSVFYDFAVIIVVPCRVRKAVFNQ